VKYGNRIRERARRKRRDDSVEAVVVEIECLGIHLVDSAVQIEPIEFSTSVGEHFTTDVDADDLARRREIAKVLPSATGYIEHSPIRVVELPTTIPTGEQLVESLPSSELVGHACVRVGDFLG
jgi:hypothetical protein